MLAETLAGGLSPVLPEGEEPTQPFWRETGVRTLYQHTGTLARQFHRCRFVLRKWSWTYQVSPPKMFAAAVFTQILTAKQPKAGYTDFDLASLRSLKRNNTCYNSICNDMENTKLRGKVGLQAHLLYNDPNCYNNECTQRRRGMLTGNFGCFSF